MPSEQGGLPPSEWQPFEADEHGYPEEWWLEHFARRAYCSGEAARFLVNDLPRIADMISCLSVHVTELPADSVYAPGKLVHYVTGGWSGAEDLIAEMLRHFWIEHMHSQWKRGGAFWFTVPDSYLKMPATPDVAMRFAADPRPRGAVGEGQP